VLLYCYFAKLVSSVRLYYYRNYYHIEYSHSFDDISNSIALSLALLNTDNESWFQAYCNTKPIFTKHCKRPREGAVAFEQQTTECHIHTLHLELVH